MSRDPRAPRRVVVVGAGLAGLRTASELRTQGFGGHVVVLGAEGVPPYDRPPLSKHLLDVPQPVWLADDLGTDLADVADAVHLDDPAERLEVGDGQRPATVTTRSGAVHTADAVVLACGSHPVRPAGWDGALVLHTAADAAALRSRIAAGARLVIAGAGWIGAEVATVAAAAGADVTVLEAGRTPLERQLGPAVGGRFARSYAAAGIDLRLETPVASATAREAGVRVTAADGTELDADVALAAVGVRPATAWLTGVVPLTPSGYVAAGPDGAVEGLEDRGVWAVGDCALRNSTRHGLVPGGHWTAALEDPARLVRSLLAGWAGGDVGPAPGVVPPEPAPYVFSTQLGHEVAAFGRTSADSRVVLRGEDPQEWTALYLEADADLTERLVGVVVVDRPRDVGQARKLLAQPEPPALDLARAADPAVPLRSTVLA
ncbi:NAD(P)/FAD-dependent oxidoreductase [Beutenbergia cavernae]|uniref:NAD(P)/FAD-dependent oxidoreductase n=1 Tax=Beutenbergia cavernae TaxID=84757 RepID=UPI0002D4C4AD|nr:FAD-dependent oxidoreductase [Beutenbergia cavernae]